MIERFFSWLEPFAGWMRQRDQNSKIAIIGFMDLALFALMVLIAYALRISSFEMPPSVRIPHYAIGPILSVAAASFFGIYRSSTRNYSANLESRILASQVIAVLIWAFLLLFIGVDKFARSVVLIYFVLSLVTMIGVRRVASWMFSRSLDRKRFRSRVLKPIVIYGAGREGMQLVDALHQHGQYKAVALFDTDYTLVDRHVAGLKVHSIEDLKSIVERYQPVEAVIAKPKQNRTSRRQLVDLFLEQGLKVKTIPDMSDIISGDVNIAELRDVKLEDLLGREPVPPDASLMDKVIKEKVVMITGAGGSIGSELARQAFHFRPKLIILLDSSEFSLFEIHRQLESLKDRYGGPVLLPVLGNILDEKLLFDLMQGYCVQVVFHAAAYKHVRMVQENSNAGILNNVLGTRTVAEAALKAKVERFVLISTDKAVRPTSVMGATKRVAELLVQALANKRSSNVGYSTIFSIVRFGNVLGSTGSVVPLFREQIEMGGPVLVTDPDVTRYFMLIPEAAQLVIQAGAMAEGGEVFVLDMGEPVKIVKLAQTMIELAGLTPALPDESDGDIEIRFIGLRDGEKLYEELQIGHEIFSTPHQRILRSNEFFLPWRTISSKLSVLRNAIEDGDAANATNQIFELARIDGN